MNWKYCVDRYRADCEEESWANGLCGGGSSWHGTGRDLRSGGSYDSIRDALEEVCSAHGFTFRPEDFEWNPLGDEDFGRWDTYVEVDDNNSEADERQLAEWREGKLRLWCCHLSVHLVKRAECEITEEEARSWMN